MDAHKVRYRNVRAGNYVLKAALPSSAAHRQRFIPLFEHLISRKDTVVLMHDETTINVNLSQPKAFLGDEQDATDKRQKGGKGAGTIQMFRTFYLKLVFQGVGVSAFLDLKDEAILMAQNPGEHHAGGYRISGSIVKRKGNAKKGGGDLDDEEEDGDDVGVRAGRPTLADQGMDDSPKFQFLLREAIRDAKTRHPGLTVVVVVDGGGPHTTEPATSLRPNNMSGDEITEELKRAGLWVQGMNLKDAKRTYTTSPIPRSQWTNAELIALEEGAIVIFLPNAHPFLNVIEQVVVCFLIVNCCPHSLSPRFGVHLSKAGEKHVAFEISPICFCIAILSWIAFLRMLT